MLTSVLGDRGLIMRNEYLSPYAVQEIAGGYEDLEKGHMAPLSTKRWLCLIMDS